MKTALFPVGITPTKFLTPTHVKGILQIDLYRRLLMVSGHVDLIYNRRIWDSSLQTLHLWNQLNQTESGRSFETTSDLEISKLYSLASKAKPVDISPRRALQERVVRDGYIHPVSIRITEIWAQQLSRIGIDSDFLSTSQPLTPFDTVLDEIRRCSYLLDYDAIGGGAYLDMTDQNFALRQLRSKTGEYNYLVPMISVVRQLTISYERVILCCDISVTRDFQLLQKMFETKDTKLELKLINRVSLDGRDLSSKEGIPYRFSFAQSIEPFFHDYTRADIRLGLLLYFLHAIPPKGGRDFNQEELAEQIALAATVLEKLGEYSHPDDALHPQLRKRIDRLDYFGILSLLKSSKTEIYLKRQIAGVLLS